MTGKYWRKTFDFAPVCHGAAIYLGHRGWDLTHIFCDHLCIVVAQDTAHLVPSHGGLQPILQTLNPTVWGGSFLAVCTILYIRGSFMTITCTEMGCPRACRFDWLIKLVFSFSTRHRYWPRAGCLWNYFRYSVQEMSGISKFGWA